MLGSTIFGRPRYDKSSARGLARSSAFAMVARIANGTSTFLISLFIGRLGGTALLGLTQTITATASLASALYPTPAGMNASRSVASSNARSEPLQAQRIARFLANRVLLVSVVLATGGIAYTALTNRPNIELALASGLAVLSLSLRAFIEGLHFGGGESRRLALWSSGIALLNAVSTLGLLLIGVRTIWVIAPLIFLNLAFAVCSWPKRSDRLTDSATKADISRFIRLAVVGTLSSAGFTQLAVLLAATINGFDYAGTYAAANTLTAPITMLASALGSVLFPALASAHAAGSTDELRTRLNRSSSLLATLILFVCIPALLLAAPIVNLLWGSAFSDTAWILLFSVPAVALGAISSPAVSAITSESNRGMAISATSSVCGALIGAAVWACAIPFFPRVAIPLGYLTGITVVAVVPWVLAWRRFSMRWGIESLTISTCLLGSVTAGFVLQQVDAPAWLMITVTVVALTAWAIIRRRYLGESLRMIASLTRR